MMFYLFGNLVRFQWLIMLCLAYISNPIFSETLFVVQILNIQNALYRTLYKDCVFFLSNGNPSNINRAISIETLQVLSNLNMAFHKKKHFKLSQILTGLLV
jgi:hypothetical protein